MKDILYFLKYLTSFLVPVVMEKKQGTLSPVEVCLVNGRYHLNSAHVNYSFGGLHTVFERVFAHLEIQDREFSSVLVLGFGAGSVADILRNRYEKNAG